METTKYIFGYGSLLNEKSARNIGPCDVISESSLVRGYRRSFNALCDGHMYLNIIPDAENDVMGVILKVPECSMKNLLKREEGYDLVQINDALQDDVDEDVFTFLMNDTKREKKTIRLSYIATCLAGVESDQWYTWLLDSVIDYHIYDDASYIREYQHTYTEEQFLMTREIIYELFPKHVVQSV